MLRLIYREAQIKLGTHRVTTDLGLTSTLSDARSHSNNVFPRHIVQKHPPVDVFYCDLPLCLCLLSAMAASCFSSIAAHQHNITPLFDPAASTVRSSLLNRCYHLLCQPRNRTMLPPLPEVEGHSCKLEEFRLASVTVLKMSPLTFLQALKSFSI